jgi:hypothetical protein
MKQYFAIIGAGLGGLAALGLLAAPAHAAGALGLHPDNPHYFLFRGKPTIIVSASEHYGAVLNRDFDYVKYLDTLAGQGLNGTRTWVGAYCEPAGAFKIAANTLAPEPGRFISPWERSDTPGYHNGGNKFDLGKWSGLYFARLKDFVHQASRRGIIVEVNLFCPFYQESMWQLSPMNAANNVNGLGALARTNVYTLDRSGDLLAVQDALVRKVVTELKGFDNCYYEICNEPYFGGVTPDWQRHIAEVITETEKGLHVRHLISQNVANGQARVQDPPPEVALFNFHYAAPPDAVTMNYDLNKVIGENETGFRGTNDAPYRMEAWDFIVAGGALFNHLDYSFAVGYENGAFAYPDSQPGGGSAALRRQLRFLARFMKQRDLIHFRPENSLLTGDVPAGLTARVLANPGQDYVVYVRLAPSLQPGGPQPAAFGEREMVLELALPAGEFEAQWFDPASGQALSYVRFSHPGGGARLAAPAFAEDIVLAVRKP